MPSPNYPVLCCPLSYRVAPVLRINDRTVKKVAMFPVEESTVRGLCVELGPLPGEVHLVIYRRLPITAKPQLEYQVDRMSNMIGVFTKVELLW